jgi:hypothetical protein
VHSQPTQNQNRLIVELPSKPARQLETVFRAASVGTFLAFGGPKSRFQRRLPAHAEARRRLL